ncbi:response regulator [Accumulibacter sp.]|uniref:response regulator n=1 Tax=Accumulibacter sp. TaxID=2053492 RepID=UPI0035B3F069
MGERRASLGTAASAISVMVVDDHPALRAGLRSLIESDAGLRVLVDVASGEAAYGEYRAQRPDVVVMDLSMDGFGGIEAIRRIRSLDPLAAILVYSVHDSRVLLERAFEAGAMGFVTKGSNVDSLLLGIHTVVGGQPFVSPDMVPLIMQRLGSPECGPFGRLTQREFQVFRLLSEGHSLAECARLLHLSSKTVSNHFTQIRAKVGVTSPAEMARLAIKHGLVEP